MEEKNVQLNICYSCMTGMPEGSTVCPACGNDNRVRSNPENTLPEGTVLFRKYLVGKVIGRGGFGVTYIGYDLDLQLKVAIKEYFPAGVSIRTSGSYNVISDISSSQDHTAFSKGCEAFLDEARMLASVNSPYIVHVRDFFREHGTAYIVMDYVNGLTLPKAISRNGGRISAERVVSLMLPLIDQLDELHERNIIHRDIKPDNIMMVKDRKGIHPVLLDFGAARSFISSNVSKTYTAVVTPGFAPLEQYSQRSRQGAFTDVYGICATMYYAITGTIPPTATERSAEDIPIRSFRSFGLDVPQHIERAIIHGLALKSSDRTQTMQALYAELSGGTTVRNSGQSSQATASQAPAHHAAKRPSSHIRQKDGYTGRAESGKTRKSAGRKIAVILLALFIVAFAGTSAVYLFGPGNRRVLNYEDSQGVSTTPFSEIDQQESPGEAEQVRAIDLDGISVGSMVSFGAYEQDNDLTNGKEPIEWQVLEVMSDKALLLSKYALDLKPYNMKAEDTTWETCDLRAWLNDSFYHASFSEQERNHILLKNVKADRSVQSIGVAGHETEDTVFLLSIQEAKRYSARFDALCDATPYVKAQNNVISNKGNAQWWLRSTGYYQNSAAYVNLKGTINETGYLVNGKVIAIRPAIWISLNEKQDRESASVSTITTAPDHNQEKPNGNTNSFPDAVKVGDFVPFGTYEQDNDVTNGKETIEWLVLEVRDKKALLLSKYALDLKPYNTKTEDTTWETCDLRAWLNDSFYGTSFTNQEKSRILYTNVKADRSTQSISVAGHDTEDAVFLLSIQEAKRYSAIYDALCDATPYVKAQNNVISNKGNAQWWLRSTGYYQNSAAFVNLKGTINETGYLVNGKVIAIRPALWVDISSLQ